MIPRTRRRGARMEIKDKVAVVTGGASGIGRAVALELARRGAQRIGLVDLSDQVQPAADLVNKEAGRDVAVAFRGDVRSEEHTSELQSLRHLVCRLLLEKNND